MAWYSRSFRRNLVDMHIEGDNPEYLSRFDPGEYYECLRRGRVQSPMIYLQSHVGLCNWGSESGEVHPASKGRDKVRELIDLCHAGGMDVIAYYSLIYNNWAYERHPEWRMRRADGKQSREFGRYGLVCPNAQGYREFVIAQFAELSRVYDFEAIFLDMTFWPFVCVCDHCRDRLKREENMDFPPAVDWGEDRWLRFQRARDRWMGEFAWFATREIKRVKPGVDVEHQYSTMSQPWFRGVTEMNAQASDYAGGDLYGGHQQQSLVCKMYREITENQPFEYMTSRCDPNLNDHTTTKSPDSLRLHNYLTLAHHGAFLAIDAIDPRGTLNSRFYDVLGGVFAESERYEPFLTGSMRAEAALYFSLTSKMNALAAPAPLPEPDAADMSHPQLDALSGAARALQDAHTLYTCVPSSKPEKLAGKRLVIVSGARFLSEREIAALAGYARAGGGLYIGGNTDPRLARALLGLEIGDATKERLTYIAPTEKGLKYFGEMYGPDMPVAFNGRQMLARGAERHDVLATITLPYTDPADFRRFASIHANPPGRATERPSLVLGRCGEGRVLWSASSFEQNPQMAHRAIFIRLLGLLVDQPPMLTTDAPGFVTFTAFDDYKKRRTLLHAVNIQEGEPILPAGPFTVAVSTPEPAETFRLLPDGRSAPCALDGQGRAVVHADGLHIFSMWEIAWR